MKTEREIAKELRKIQYKILFGEFYWKKNQKFDQ